MKFKLPIHLWLLIYSLVLWTSCSTSPRERRDADIPGPYNILFIAVDDLNDWTGFLDGHPHALTPAYGSPGQSTG